MYDYTDKLRRYMPFNSSEIKAIFLTIVFMTFIVAFNDHNDTFKMADWTSNFLMWLFIVGTAVIIKQVGHRMIGLAYGFRVEYQLWWYGLLAGVLLALVTRSHIWLLIPGGIMIHHMAVHRLGWFRYGTNMGTLSMIALWGPLANILFGSFIKILQTWFNAFPAESAFVYNLFLFNFAFATFSMLPIPPLDGSKVFFDSRYAWGWFFGAMVVFTILAMMNTFMFINLIILMFILVIYYFTMLQN